MPKIPGKVWQHCQRAVLEGGQEEEDRASGSLVNTTQRVLGERGGGICRASKSLMWYSWVLTHLCALPADSCRGSVCRQQ
jgi:hypothetical protein